MRIEGPEQFGAVFRSFGVRRDVDLERIEFSFEDIDEPFKR
jgi:hypothetical protein